MVSSGRSTQTSVVESRVAMVLYHAKTVCFPVDSGAFMNSVVGLRARSGKRRTNAESLHKPFLRRCGTNRATYSSGAKGSQYRRLVFTDVDSDRRGMGAVDQTRPGVERLVRCRDFIEFSEIPLGPR